MNEWMEVENICRVGICNLALLIPKTSVDGIDLTEVKRQLHQEIWLNGKKC